MLTSLVAGCPRTDESRCGDAACKLSDWEVVLVVTDTDGNSRLHQLISGDTTVLAIEPSDAVVSASINRSNSALAVVTDRGRVKLAPSFSEPVFTDVQVDRPAIGVAWSNARSLLALVVRANDGAHSVLILDDAGEIRSELPVELTDIGAPPTSQRWRLVMSWSADDSLLAISHDDTRGATFPDTRIVDIATGSQESIPAFTAYFVDQTTLVANRGGEVYQRSNSGWRKTDEIGRPVLTSDPLTGVILASEPPGLPTGLFPQYRLGLRTRDTGPDAFGIYEPGFDDTFILVPVAPSIAEVTN